jgi:hypothetical protein
MKGAAPVKWSGRLVSADSDGLSFIYACSQAHDGDAQTAPNQAR